jgi:hypothetical protein
MLYLIRPFLALGLWLATVIVAVLAIHFVRTEPCASHTGWLIVAPGVLAAAAVFVSLRPPDSFAAGVVAAVLATVIGAAAAFGVYLLALGIWVSHCTN